MSKTPKLRFKEFSGDWEEKKLDEFLTESKIKGSTGAESKKLTVKLWGKGIIPKKETLQGSSETQYYIRKAGQLMYGKLDFLNCAFGIVPEHLDGYESTLDAPAFDIKNANGNFLLLKIIQKNFYKKYGEIADGSRKAKRVHLGTFLDMPITIPSLEEQEKIAFFISLIDDKISLQGEKVEALKDYKKGMMQKIFSRELRFKDDEGRDYPEWEEKKFKDFTKINQGLQIPISERYTTEGENRYFYITNEFLKSDSETKYYIENPSESVICYEDDILMTRTGNTGKVVTGVKGAFHNNFFKIAYDKEKYDRMFLYYILTSHKMQKNIIRLAGSSTIPDLNHSDFYNIKVKLPIVEEQKKIADLLIRLDNKIEKEQEKLDSLNEYKKGLLQQMFI